MLLLHVQGESESSTQRDVINLPGELINILIYFWLLAGGTSDLHVRKPFRVRAWLRHSVYVANMRLTSHLVLIFLIDLPLKAAEVRLMPLSGASSILAVKVVLAVVPMVAAKVVCCISLLLCVRVGYVWDIGVVRALL